MVFVHKFIRQTVVLLLLEVNMYMISEIRKYDIVIN